MEYDVGQMVPTGIRAVDFHIEHVRHHRQRVPVAGHRVGERVDDVAHVKPLQDLLIIDNVKVVIIHIDELVVQ